MIEPITFNLFGYSVDIIILSVGIVIGLVIFIIGKFSLLMKGRRDNRVTEQVEPSNNVDKKQQVRDLLAENNFEDEINV